MEKQVEQYLVKQVKSVGGWALKLCSTWVTGLPDRLVLLRGHAYFVEMKDEHGILSPMQVVVGKMLLKCGFKVRVINSKEKVKQFIDEIQST